MFTGIIQKVCKVKEAKPKKGVLFLIVDIPCSWRLKKGDSVSIDGVCLTVKKVIGSAHLFEFMPATQNCTVFKNFVPKRVNVERALKFCDFVGGHLVSGHIDAVGRIVSVKTQGSAKIYRIEFPKKFAKHLVTKGSIAVDGISLTIVKSAGNHFTVSLVDYTIRNTTLGNKQRGDLVNLEFDILAKYLEKLKFHK